MNRRPPQLSPVRLLAGVVLPLLAYLIIRALTGSSIGGAGHHRRGPVGLAARRRNRSPSRGPDRGSLGDDVMIALAAYALTGGGPLAIKLRRGAVTGTIGIAGLASVALGR
jgi:hypothetical protein